MRRAWEAVVYIGALLTGLGLVSTGFLPASARVSLVVAFGGMIASVFFDGDRANFIRGTSVALAFLFTGKIWGLGGAIASFGFMLRYAGSRRDSLPLAGTGETLVLIGLSAFLPDELRLIPVLGGAFLLLGYLMAWRNPEFLGSVLGFGLLGSALGAYLAVRPFLAGRYPGVVFYAEWLALLVGVMVAIGIILGRGERPEEYMEELLANGPVLRLPPESRVEEIIREFIRTGRKAELLSYIAFYGSRAFGSRKELLKAIEKLSEYEPKRPGPLTPVWLRRKILRDEVERRKRLVEEVLALLEGSL